MYFETREKLLAADTDNAADAYVRTAAGVAILTDDATGPDADNVDARLLDVTPDGSRVVFETRESLAASDTDTMLDIYERASSGALTHISRNPTGSDGAFDGVLRRLVERRLAHHVRHVEKMAATDTDTASDSYVRRSDGALVHVTDGTGADQNMDATTHAHLRRRHARGVPDQRVACPDRHRHHAEATCACPAGRSSI